MTRFPTPGHLVSWAKFAPGISSSAGKTKGNGSTGHGNRYLARVLGEAAVGVGKTDTFLGARYRRIARRRGKKKAIVAVGRSILVIIWHLLPDPDTRFHDLGADHYDRHIAPPRSDTTTSASSKPSATASPSNPPPDQPRFNQHLPGQSIFGLASMPLAGRPFRAENGAAPAVRRSSMVLPGRR